ncbi:MAG TPA: segregation/condensation protein A [Candidatus Paceibacterota bacterium]|nr:segregation/condensation protein A [Candidatus Paceibacterota bacterium]
MLDESSQQAVTAEYKVKVGEFEGPLDLLLSLIEKRKLCINDISIAEVTDGYIEYVKGFEEFPMAGSADFLIVASTLLLIKSLSLLPGITLTPEEKDSIEDLEARLKTYKDIKEKSAFIKECFGKNPIFFGGLKRKADEVIFMPTDEIVLVNMLNSAKALINNLPKKEKLSEVKIKKVISLEEAIDNLHKKIQQGLRMKFSDFAKTGPNNSPEEAKANKIHVVVSFLAMLELIKRGTLRYNQEVHFADIHLESNDVTTPHYGGSIEN